jgi:hypothetical protein
VTTVSNIPLTRAEELTPEILTDAGEAQQLPLRRDEAKVTDAGSAMNSSHSDESQMNANMFMNPTCRDTESDCSFGICVEACETEDTDAETPVESTPDEDEANAATFAGSESGEDSDKDVTDNEDSDNDATDDEENEDPDTFDEQSPGASEEAPSVREETSMDMLVNSTCRDEESDCSIESDTGDDETDVDASVESSVQHGEGERETFGPGNDEHRHPEINAGAATKGGMPRGWSQVSGSQSRYQR